MKEYDVVIIGAGSGGLSARREVAKKTENYLVVNSGPLGTTCARVGCMPSKVLIQTANDFARRKKFEEAGIKGSENLSLDKTKVMEHVRALRDRFVRGVVNDMESWKDEKLLAKKAKFVSPYELDCEGEIVKGKKIVIAVGSRPNIPKPIKEFQSYILTTDQIFELDELPASVAVIGLGVIGLELGQAMHRLGVEVTMIGRRKVFAGVTDPELNEYVTKKFSEELSISFEGINSASEKNGKLAILTGDKEILVDRVLVASGRDTNIDKINIEALDIELNDRGIPDFDSETFQLIDHPHIFLAGDVTGENQILHEASDEGKIAGYNAVNPVTKFKTRSPLAITFCDPNIASVGLSYGELFNQKRNFVTGEVSFEGQGRSIVKLKEIGLLRIYGEETTGEILGAEMFGPEAEHIAHLLSWVIEQKLDVNKVLSFPFYHPVIEEGLRTALRDLRSKMQIKSSSPLEVELKEVL